MLRWHLGLGHIAIPKFEPDEQDMAAFATLDDGERLGPHPDAPV
ncbi:hypothetical protein ABZ863_23275 [Saccharomonospora sp. NPDC046836]